MQKFECKVCGAGLKWNPVAGKIACEYCNAEFPVTDFEDHTLRDEVNDNQVDDTYSSEEITDGMVIYKCEECNAEVITSDKTMATECAYCGHAITITSKAVGNFRPECVIPFAITKETAMEIFKKYVKSSWLTPKVFSTSPSIEKMQGLFVPYYLHSMVLDGMSIVEGERTTSHKRGYDKITDHKVYEVDVEVHADFNNIPTDASKQLEDGLMDTVEPYDYNNVKDYNPAYLAGFFAEQADVTKEDTIQRAKDKAYDGMSDKIRECAGNLSKKCIKSNLIDKSNEKISYTMLPIWLFHVKWKDTVHHFAINGQTGKVVGKLPLDKVKLVISSIGIALGTLLLTAFIS